MYGSLSAPQDSQFNSQTMKEKQQVQDALISNINIIHIGNEEALTINNDLLENTTYFLTMMRGLDLNFMLSELKIEKTDTA